MRTTTLPHISPAVPSSHSPPGYYTERVYSTTQKHEDDPSLGPHFKEIRDKMLELGEPISMANTVGLRLGTKMGTRDLPFMDDKFLLRARDYEASQMKRTKEEKRADQKAAALAQQQQQHRPTAASARRRRV